MPNPEDIPEGPVTIWPDNPKIAPFEAYLHPASKPKHNYNIKWAVIWLENSEIGAGILEQAKLEEMTLSDYRVRDYLIGTIGIGNYVLVNKSEIGRELNLHRVTVCESIKRLCNLAILIEGPKNGRSSTYMISPAFCFSGGLGNGIKARTEIIKSTKAKLIDFNLSLNNIKK